MSHGSDYIRWAKSRERFRYNIGRSSIRPCPVEQFDPSSYALAVNGPNAHGWNPLRQALGDRYGVPIDEVVLAGGTSMANHLALTTLVEPGDEVLVESPCYEPLRALPALFGCGVRSFARRRRNGWALDPEEIEAALTPSTRVIMVSDLHNPTGVRAGEEAIAALAELAERHDLFVIVDEVYLEFLPTAEFRIAARQSPRMLSTCSLTKAYGLDGLRAGWIVAAPAIAARIREINDLYGIIMAHPSEQLALHALGLIDQLHRGVAELVSNNRGRFERFLDEQPQLDWHPPAAGPIGFVRLRDASVEALVQLLERDYDATLPPGRFFGIEDHFRVGFGMEPPDLEAGLERLAAALGRVG